MSAKLVVVGGSRGGTDALARVLAGIPASFPLPIAVVLHRAATSGEDLAALVAARSGLSVKDAGDRDETRPGTVAIAPADYHLLVDGDRYALSTEAPLNWSRPSIDVLFQSAAESCGAGVVAVVLTGSSADGAAGARRVEALGGRVLVQDPASAQAPEMPRATIAATRAPEILPLEGIASALARLASRRDIE